MKTLRASLLAAALVLLAPAVLRAGDVVNNLATTRFGGEVLDVSGKAGARSILIGTLPVRLESITVRIADFAGTSVAAVKIWTGTASVPVTLVEDLGIVQANGNPASNYPIASTAHPVLAAGARYWVSVENVSGNLD